MHEATSAKCFKWQHKGDGSHLWGLGLELWVHREGTRLLQLEVMSACTAVGLTIPNAIGEGDEGIMDLMGALWDEASKAAVF